VGGGGVGGGGVAVAGACQLPVGLESRAKQGGWVLGTTTDQRPLAIGQWPVGSRAARARNPRVAGRHKAGPTPNPHPHPHHHYHV
jgi:hypothetical protein